MTCVNILELEGPLNILRLLRDSIHSEGLLGGLNPVPHEFTQRENGWYEWCQENWGVPIEETILKVSMRYTDKEKKRVELYVKFTTDLLPPLNAYKAYLKKHGEECSMVAFYCNSEDKFYGEFRNGKVYEFATRAVWAGITQEDDEEEEDDEVEEELFLG